MAERRRSIRRRLQQKLEVINLNTGATIGILGDITPEGMLLECPQALKEDCSHELRLLLPIKIFGKDFLDLSACCVWTRETKDKKAFQCGLEFVEVTPQDVGIVIGLIMDVGLPD